MYALANIGLFLRQNSTRIPPEEQCEIRIRAWRASHNGCFVAADLLEIFGRNSELQLTFTGATMNDPEHLRLGLAGIRAYSELEALSRWSPIRRDTLPTAPSWLFIGHQ